MAVTSAETANLVSTSYVFLSGKSCCSSPRTNIPVLAGHGLVLEESSSLLSKLRDTAGLNMIHAGWPSRELRTVLASRANYPNA